MDGTRVWARARYDPTKLGHCTRSKTHSRRVLRENIKDFFGEELRLKGSASCAPTGNQEWITQSGEGGFGELANGISSSWASRKDVKELLVAKQLLEVAMLSGNSVVPERLEFIPELKATI